MSLDYLLQNAARLHEQGRLDEAEAIYRRLLEVNPEQTDVLHLLGMIAMQRRSFDSAIDMLYKAVRLSPQTDAYEFTLAQVLQESGRPKEALEHYKAVSARREYPETYHNMGIVYRFLGDAELARKMFEKAVEMRPDFSSAYVNLALIARDGGDFAGALVLLDKAVAADPQNAEAYAQQAVTRRLAGENERAVALYEKALSLAESPVYYNGLGIAFENLNRTDDAFNAYCRAIELDPSCADAYSNRANVYVKYGKHWQAEDDYKKAVKLDPQFASAYNNLGALLYDHGRFEEALECYRKAFIINPKQAETCCNLAMAVKEAGDPAEAVGLYFNALALNPALTEIHHDLARTLYDLYGGTEPDCKETAVKLAQKWKQFFPDNPVAAHVCAALQGDNPPRAGDAYVETLFDSFAETFDAAVGDLDYRVPELVAGYVKTLPVGLRILDAGCGTGLNAAALKPRAAKLSGVDLSAKMLDAAGKRGLYDALEKSDAVAFCHENPSAFDLVVWADVACYFGDLTDLLAASARALAAGGRVVFTVEKAENPDGYALRPSGRYVHGAAYVENALKRAGFSGIALTDAVLRRERGADVAGIFAAAEKTGGDAN